MLAYGKKWETIVSLLPHRSKGELRKRYSKIEADWAPRFEQLRAEGVNAAAAAFDAKRERDAAAEAAQRAGQVVETPKLWYPEGMRPPAAPDDSAPSHSGTASALSLIHI